MITTIAFLLDYFLLCFLLFEVVQKPLFAFYNKSTSTHHFSRQAFREVYRHGWRSDLIACAYLVAIPLLICWLHLHLPFFSIRLVMTIYNLLMAFLISLLVVSDTLVYRYWHSKIDFSAISYLRSLKGVFASLSSKYIVLSLLLWMVVGIIIFVLCNGLSRAILTEDATVLPKPIIWHVVNIVLYIAMVGVLFIVVRGEGIRPNNPSIAYFSKNTFLNHCALNPLYNFVYSISLRNEYKGKFHFFTDEECEKKFAGLFPTTGTPQVELLNTTRPNILLIIWESLGARFMESLGGTPNVTVNMDRFAREGVLFTHCDCGSFRTDRALPCILSGLPAQPTASIIRHTQKLPKLPALPRRLRDDLGYDTVAIHGGDCYIMHKADYYLASGHNNVIEQKDIHVDRAETCKWGIHDGDMFRYLYVHIQNYHNLPTPWFITFQTLSSHEPFVVPYSRLTDEMNNAFAYTDDCLGRFLDKLKTSPMWDNLLIIITGDHNINNGAPMPLQEYAHIPLLMIGGAVKGPQKIDTIMSQTDIAATLLGQMGLSHEEFRYSRDVLAGSYTYPFSFHTFVNGFLFRDNTGFTHYDNVSQTAIAGSSALREENGKVILQSLYNDLSKI